MQIIELAILDWIQEYIRCPFLVRIVPVFTRFNDNGEIWIILAVLLVLFQIVYYLLFQKLQLIRNTFILKEKLNKQLQFH